MDVFGSSGVRGVVGEDLTPVFVGRIAAAAGRVLEADAVAVARDTRTTGPLLGDAAASNLAAAGVNVERLGVVPTPGVAAYTEQHGVPGVVITASHNPPEYNGIKLISADGMGLSAPALERIEAEIDSKYAVSYADVGRSRNIEDARDVYIDGVVDRLNAEGRADRIADADLTVAVDPGHGAGALTNPRLFRELGCRVVTVNADPNGCFPGRNPEPVAANLADLRRVVRASGADIGIAHDGDADRAIFVDETGAHIDGDASFAALAAVELGAGDAVVSAVNVSQRVVDVADATDADVELTPIGSTYLLTRIGELRDSGRSVPIAGEGNGGLFFPPYRTVRDGAYTAARFLDLLVDRPASAVAEAHAGYASVRRNLEYGRDDEREAMLEAAERYARDADAEVTTIDGYRLDYGDAWVLVRPSGTEPLVRLYAEANERDRAEVLLDEMYETIADANA